MKGSRDFRVRGKRFDNDEWVVGYYLCLNGDEYIIEDNTGYFDINCGEVIFSTAYCNQVIPETIESMIKLEG